MRYHKQFIRNWNYGYGPSNGSCMRVLHKVLVTTSVVPAIGGVW